MVVSSTSADQLPRQIRVFHALAGFLLRRWTYFVDRRYRRFLSQAIARRALPLLSIAAGTWEYSGSSFRQLGALVSSVGTDL